MSISTTTANTDDNEMNEENIFDEIIDTFNGIEDNFNEMINNLFNHESNSEKHIYEDFTMGGSGLFDTKCKLTSRWNDKHHEGYIIKCIGRTLCRSKHVKFCDARNGEVIYDEEMVTKKWLKFDTDRYPKLEIYSYDGHGNQDCHVTLSTKRE